MKAEQLWADFCNKKKVDINTPYEAWSFGEDEEGDRLLKLVLDGKKFGTSSLYVAYEAKEYGIKFTEESKVVCEKFSLEYALDKERWDFNHNGEMNI